jgi:hypothetical protein
MRIGDKAWFMAVSALLAIGASAGADEAKQDGSGFAAALQTGFATGDSSTGVTLGGSVLYDVIPRLSIEASGAYLDRGRGEGGATGTVSLLLNLRPSGEKVVPYLAVGGGIYHTSFEGSDWLERFVPGGTAGFEMPAGLGMPGGFELPAGLQIPGFEGGRLAAWRERLSEIAGTCRNGGCPLFEGDGPWESSTDGVMTIGGGIRIDLGHGLFLRPDIRAIVIFGDDTRTLGALNVGLGYRF